MRIVGAALLSVVLFGVVACSQPSTRTAPSLAPVLASRRVDGADVSVTIPRRTLLAGSSQRATVAIVASSDTTVTVADILGVRICAASGEKVFDSLTQRPRYPLVSIELPPGRSKEREIDFVVPEPGEYEIAGYLMDGNESGQARFTSLEP